MRTRRSQSSSDPTLSGNVDRHIPVLLHETLESLAIASDDCVVDATLGGAGHARAIAEKLGADGVLIGFDLDPDAIERARDALSGARPQVHLVNADFRTISHELSRLGIEMISKAVFDLGWSSYQLDAGRGFSFLRDEPLAMTYAPTGLRPLTAAIIVNEWAEESIADVIYGWGEERYARRIARSIVDARQRRLIKTSGELAEIVRLAVPGSARHGRIHPATKTFQALRIAVNDELGALSEGLRRAWNLMVPDGRIAVISFHSIEDRVVKRQYAEWEDSGVGMRITKKPIVASAGELAQNPRARSAKLRIIQKIST